MGYGENYFQIAEVTRIAQLSLHELRYLHYSMNSALSHAQLSFLTWNNDIYIFLRISLFMLWLFMSVIKSSIFEHKHAYAFNQRVKGIIFHFNEMWKRNITYHVFMKQYKAIGKWVSDGWTKWITSIFISTPCKTSHNLYSPFSIKRNAVSKSGKSLFMCDPIRLQGKKWHKYL